MCNNPVSLREFNSNFNKAVLSRPSIRIHFGTTKVPCGNCLGCRLDKLALWSSRCNYELVKGNSSFVTFTYDKWHLPKNELGLATLKRDDLHKYIDNIRHKINNLPFTPKGIRKDFSFFGSGEYGDTFQRPHYHVLFFGLDYQACKKFFVDSWKKGTSIKVCPVSLGGVRYVVDYFTKNFCTGELAQKLYDNKGLERPFKIVSRGLGSELFYTHRDEIRKGLPLKLGSRYIPVPTYYKNLYSHFSDDEIFSRFSEQKKELLRLEKLSKKRGYSSLDSYIKDTCLSREKELESKFRSKGIGVVGNYHDCDKNFVSMLATSALSD